MKKTIERALLSTAMIFLWGQSAWCHAQIFSDLSLEQAKQQAKKEQKLLLVDFTASWCPPCKKMESTTWSNSDVQAWVKENAVALQIDVDKDEKTTSALNVEAMPTLVLFTPQNNSEFGRQVGFMGASELLQWLEGAKSGKANKVEQSNNQEPAQDQNENQSNDIWSRINKARELQSAAKNAEALEEYVWLWNNISTADSSLRDFRYSMLPAEVKRLSAVHPAAKAKITELRDAAEKDNRGDWIVLNGALGDNAHTLAWFDKIKIDAKQGEILKKNAALLEPVLYSNLRWTDLTNYLYPDPIAKVNEIYKQAKDMTKPRPDTEFAKDFDPFPNMVLLLYGSYIGAGREADAKKIADECLRLDNTQAMREALDNMAKGMQSTQNTNGVHKAPAAQKPEQKKANK